MSTPPLRLRAPRLFVLHRVLFCGCLVALAACTADPPDTRPGEFPNVGVGGHPSVATCWPAGACPGSTCAQNVLGPPDQAMVDLNACTTLDLVFSGGVIRATGVADAGPGDFEILVTLGALTGLTRVEASVDGLKYVTIGYLADSPNRLPPKTPDTCLARASGTQAWLSLSLCNSITDVGFLRLANDRTSPGAAVIDAVEAISFAPRESITN